MEEKNVLIVKTTDGVIITEITYYPSKTSDEELKLLICSPCPEKIDLTGQTKKQK